MQKLAMILSVVSVSLLAQGPKHQNPALPRTSDGKADLSAPAIGVGPFPIKVVQNPGLVVILHEYDTLFRQVFTDGRALPEDPNPTWMGYSVGHWDGDTLIVTTAGFNDRTTIDLAGHPHTEALRMTERFHRRDIGHLDVQITCDDPKAYARPWTLPMEFALVPEDDLMEYVCENERDAIHLVGKSEQEFRISADELARYVGAYQAPGAPSRRCPSKMAALWSLRGNPGKPRLRPTQSQFSRWKERELSS